MAMSVPVGAMEWDQFIAGSREAEDVQHGDIKTMKTLLQLPCLDFSETPVGHEMSDEELCDAYSRIMQFMFGPFRDRPEFPTGMPLHQVLQA
jgi:hypothetical protein